MSMTQKLNNLTLFELRTLAYNAGFKQFSRYRKNK